MKQNISYRAYIDGLRAVAVVAVILYHAKLLSFTGGFVGVDIFFVISGFLITTIIVHDIQSGTFSLLQFWERRIRRIIPTLFLVGLLGSIAAYFLILYPEDYRYFGNALIAQNTFVSNVLFMLSDNYFNEHSRYSPLLHTWSLSVEEQFYVIFPFIILLSIKLTEYTRFSRLWLWLSRPNCLSRSTPPTYQGGMSSSIAWSGDRMLVLIVLTLGVISLLLNIWFIDFPHSFSFKIPFLPSEIFWGTTYATAGFYLLLTRAWEFAIGILLALTVIRIRSRLLAEVISTTGLVAIGTSFFLYTDSTAFPGLASLLPTIGTSAIIIANENYRTKIGVLLSTPILVGIGLVSYSLYLWHWPLLVFTQLANPVPLGETARWGIIAFAVCISWLSYRLIEIPIRKKHIFTQRKTLFYTAFLAMATLVLVGLVITRTASVSSGRIPLPAQNVLRAVDVSIPWGAECFQLPGDAEVYGGLCRIGDYLNTSKREFVVWGDSHAEALVPLLASLARTHGMQGAVFAAGNCVPIVGVSQTPAALGCREENEFALHYIRDKNIQQVILVARWSYYVSGGPNRELSAMISDALLVSTSSEGARSVFERNFLPMVKELVREGREVYIVLQAPEQRDFTIREVFYRAALSNQEVHLRGVRTNDSQAYQAPAISVIANLRIFPSVHIFDPATILCKKDGYCDLLRAEKFLYRDASHLSTVGAMTLEPLFIPLFLTEHTSRSDK